MMDGLGLVDATAVVTMMEGGIDRNSFEYSGGAVALSADGQTVIVGVDEYTHQVCDQEI